MKRSLLGILLLFCLLACQIEPELEAQQNSLTLEAKSFGKPRLVSYQSCQEVELSLKQASLDYMKNELAKRLAILPKLGTEILFMLLAINLF